MTAWPREKKLVLFPLDLNVPFDFPAGNIEGLGETKRTFFASSGPVIKRLSLT